MDKFLTWRMILVLVIILSFAGSFFSDHKWVSPAAVERLILLAVPEIRRFDAFETDVRESRNE